MCAGEQPAPFDREVRSDRALTGAAIDDMMTGPEISADGRGPSHEIAGATTAGAKEGQVPYTFTLTTTIPASAQDIYDAWLDSIAHSEMTGGGDASMSDEIGAEISAWDGYISGRNLELVPGERIVQSWRTTKFTDDHADSIVTVTLEEIDGETLLTLIHSNVPDGQTSYERGGWQERYFEPMIAYFAELDSDDEDEEEEDASAPTAKPEPAATTSKSESTAPEQTKPASRKAKRSAAAKSKPKSEPKSAPKSKSKSKSRSKAKPKRAKTAKMKVKSKPNAKSKAKSKKSKSKSKSKAPTKAKAKRKPSRARRGR